jgi:hypothetical protein
VRVNSSLPSFFLNTLLTFLDNLRNIFKGTRFWESSELHQWAGWSPTGSAEIAADTFRSSALFESKTREATGASWTSTIGSFIFEHSHREENVPDQAESATSVYAD